MNKKKTCVNKEGNKWTSRKNYHATIMNDCHLLFICSARSTSGSL